MSWYGSYEIVIFMKVLLGCMYIPWHEKLQGTIESPVRPKTDFSSAIAS
jgi:hypothetical protein